MSCFINFLFYLLIFLLTSNVEASIAPILYKDVFETNQNSVGDDEFGLSRVKVTTATDTSEREDSITGRLERRLNREQQQQQQQQHGRRLQTSCTGGQYYDGATCLPCADGTYSAAGTYASGAAATTCSPCAAGRYGTGGTDQCAGACTPGRYGTGATADCAGPCAAGRYGTGADDQCSGPCGVGTYSLAGAGTCTICDAGKSSPSGSTSSAACARCDAGTYSTGNGGACLSLTCPAGKYALAGATSNTLTDSSVCASCTAGTSSASGSTVSSACTACAEGKYSLSGDPSCTDCPAGTYGSTTSLQTAACSGTCAAGKYSTEGSLSCTDCPAGSISTSAGSGTCSSCIAGSTYQELVGQTSCLTCSTCGSSPGSGIVSTTCTTTTDSVCSSPTPSASATATCFPSRTMQTSPRTTSTPRASSSSSRTSSLTRSPKSSSSPTITSSASASAASASTSNTPFPSFPTETITPSQTATSSTSASKSWSVTSTGTISSPSPSATTSPSLTTTVSASATPTLTSSASSSPSQTRSSSASRSGSLSSSPTRSGSSSASPTVTKSSTSSPSATSSGSVTTSPTQTGSTSSSPSVTTTTSGSPSVTESTSATTTISTSPSVTESTSATLTPSGSPSVTESTTPSPSATNSVSLSGTSSTSGSVTATSSRSGSTTPSPSVTMSSTPSSTSSRSGSPTATPTHSSSATSSPSITRSSTPSSSASRSSTVTSSSTHSGSSTATPTGTTSVSSSASIILSFRSSSSSTSSGTGTITTSATATGTITTSATGTGTITTSATATGTSSPTATISTSAIPTLSGEFAFGTNLATFSSSPSSTASGTGTITTSATATGTSSPTATISTSATPSVNNLIISSTCAPGSYLDSGSSQCTPCSVNTYSYGGSSCSSCPSGSTFVSSSLGCRPSSTLNSGPIDTSFYLSGSQNEGVSSFTSIINSNGLTYYSSATSYPSAALTLGSGSYLSTPLLSSLPTGSSPFTVSAWVKCSESSISSTYPIANVISWGSSLPTSSTSLTAVKLSVTSSVLLKSPIANVSTFAGSRASGSLNGVGTNAQFFQPHGIAVDHEGSVYVADTGNNLVRKIFPNRSVTSFASGFNWPQRVAVDRYKNVYVSDLWNHRICIIPHTLPSGGVCTTIVGDGTQGFINGVGLTSRIAHARGLALNASGFLFLADATNNCIRLISPSSFPPNSGTTFFTTTFAGSGLPGLLNGPSASARFKEPYDLIFDKSGNLYIADALNNCIRKIDATDGDVTTFAGDLSPGFVDEKGGSARFNDPIDLAIDASGNLFVADFYNHCIRKITPDRVVSTIAGNGHGAFADGLGTNAQFKFPTAIDTDSLGNVFVADNDNNCIRKITFSPSLPGPLPVCDSTWHHIALTYTGSSSTNTLTAYVDGVSVATSTSLTFAISSESTSTLRIGWNGIDEHFSGSISDVRVFSRSLSSSEITSLSIRTTISSPSSSPSATVTTSSSATLTKSVTPSSTATLSITASGTNSRSLQSTESSFFSSTSSRTASSSPSSSSSSTYTGSSTSSASGTKTPTGTVVSIQATPTSSATLTSSVTSTTTSSVFGITDCPSGSYVQSSSSQCTPCNVNTYSYPGASSCSTCPSGSTFISSSLGCRPTSSSSADPIDTSFYLSGSQSEGVSAFSNVVNSNGISYSTSSNSFPKTAMVISSGSYLSSPFLSSLPTGSSPFFVSCWVKCDASSLTDANLAGVVVAWGETGEVSTSSNFTAVTLAVTSASRIRGVTTVTTFAGSGSQGFSDALGTASSFSNPAGISIDALSGSLYVADYTNRRIRKISSTGIVTTLAGSGIAGFADGQGTNARFNNPQGVAVDPSGSGVVFVADTNNNRIRSVSTSGVVSTLAGSGVQGFADGSGAAAVFNRPYSLAVDSATGTVFVSDRNNHRIRKITPSGLVSTLAGGVSASFADGTGTNAKFNYPQGIVVDAAGSTLYIADSDNQRIRKITISTGVVRTIAGSGAAGDSDGLGTDASFRSPSGISLDGVGNLYITDSNNLIRKIDVITGMVTTIAGISGVADFFDGASTTAAFSSPQGIVVDPSGREVFVADYNNNRIRKINTIPNLPGPLPVCDSSYHNIALSYSTTTSSAIRRLANSTALGLLTAYIDGSSFASIPATYSTSSLSSSTFRIGSNGLTNGELFSGSISDLRIFNRALTDIELKSLSARPVTSPSPSTTSDSGSSASSSSIYIVIGAIAGVVILSGGGFGYYYNQRRKRLLKNQEDDEVKDVIEEDVVKVDSSRGVDEGSVVNVGDSPANWSSSLALTSTPLSNISSASISLASSRVTAYDDKKEHTEREMNTPKSGVKSSSSSSAQRGSGSQPKKSKSPGEDNGDEDDDLILATKREFPEDEDDDDALLPGAINKIKDGEVEEMAEEYNLQGLMSTVEGTVLGEAAGSLLTAASSALEGLALASISIPLVGLALKGLSMLCNQVEAFSRSNLEAEKLLGRLVRLQTVVQKAAVDVDFCKDHSGIFDYMVKTLNKAADKLETISKRSKFGKFIFAQSDIDIMERVDRAIMMHLTELQAAMQAQTMSMVKALHDGLLDRSSKEEEVKAPPLPPFSMRFKQSDIIFDPPLEKQLINAPRGSFGVVVFGIWKAHNLPCAVKLISSRTATGVVAVSMMSWLSEAELMRRLREHLNSVTRQTPQNICTLFGIGAVESPKTGEVTQYMVVMERLEGSLRDKLDSYLKKKRHPPLVQALTWIRDVAMGINECHDANVVHSDLKAANALLSKKNEAKLCDLGAGRVTRDMTATSSMINSTGGGIVRGSLPWLSSELLDDQNLQPSKASDVYAWACVCWEILSCRIPYHDEEGVLAIDLNKLKNLSAIVSGKLRPDLTVLRADAPSSIVEMMQRAWDPEPRDRPQIGEILETLESALSSFKDAKQGNSKRVAEAAAADLRSSALLTQAGKAEEEDAKKAVEDLKVLTKSLEEARAARIAMIKKKHDEAAMQMRAELEAEEKRLEEEARIEMSLEMEKNEAMIAQRKAKWIGEVNEKKEERLRNAHLLDEKDRARIVAEFELENREVEKKVEEARAEQNSRLEARLRERKEAKAKAALKALSKLDTDADKEVEEEKKKDVHDFLLD